MYSDDTAGKPLCTFLVFMPVANEQGFISPEQNKLELAGVMELRLSAVCFNLGILGVKDCKSNPFLYSLSYHKYLVILKP